ncbi:Uncharacterized conserved protein YbjT, contains NAD(P)-binding and DUF2867 domains [Ferrimonas sediminum]|uniref:Uncharacterized conserved protein YbjT, contains NAD(P)-binding and DUF2867 domains n=1 Tax=Ferrimonas sediminum TaxID=718193 RepID=A0A1G8M8L5_9GAMM|nr:NAD(P)H-binding protein [Ferrimonas sediminum]SDI64193.1 Uncharacterized conserved protein YbjT, contains NAD(P)-binding and DUF2867 domains [Ferrimonas sediminum]
MTQTAIVIGATGVVGRALVEQLAATPAVDRIVTLTRRPVPHDSHKVVNQVVEFDHLDRYRQWFQGQWLFSCLGTTLKQAGSLDGQRRVDLDYQYQAAQLAAANGVDHYLLVSSSGADADSGNAYLKMKGQLEQRIRALPFNRISVFQPSLLLGERHDFRPAERLGALLMPLLCLLPGLRRYRPIPGTQVAAKMVAVSQQPGHPLQTYRLDQLFD